MLGSKENVEFYMANKLRYCRWVSQFHYWTHKILLSDSRSEGLGALVNAYYRSHVIDNLCSPSCKSSWIVYGMPLPRKLSRSVTMATVGSCSVQSQQREWLGTLSIGRMARCLAWWAVCTSDESVVAWPTRSQQRQQRQQHSANSQMQGQLVPNGSWADDSSKIRSDIRRHISMLTTYSFLNMMPSGFYDMRMRSIWSNEATKLMINSYPTRTSAKILFDERKFFR